MAGNSLASQERSPCDTPSLQAHIPTSISTLKPPPSCEMPQVLRLDDGDSRIQYAPPGAWETVVNSGSQWNRDGTYHRATVLGAQLFFLFRGGSFRLAFLAHVFYMTLLTPARHWNFSLWSCRKGWSIGPATTRREEHRYAPE